MLATTVQIIKSGLQADPNITAADRAWAMSILRKGPTPQSKYDILPPNNPARLIRRAEVAARLSRSLRFVDKLAAAGVLVKRKLPGRVRASGFLEEDVSTFITGGR